VVVGVGLCALGCGGADGLSGPGFAVCTDDGGLPADAGLAPSASLASGTFTSPDVRATICRGGAFAVVAGSLEIESSFYGLPGNRFQFEKPTDAAYGELVAFFDVTDLAPGRYQSADTCGSVGFSTFLPVPASVDCQATPPAGMECPTGCALEGPISSPSCMPLMPEIDYQAGGASNCGYTPANVGSFTLSLTSVAPDAQSNGNIVVHGSLTADLVGGSDGAGTSSGSLSLAF
jgi:hypothetical protein